MRRKAAHAAGEESGRTQRCDAGLATLHGTQARRRLPSRWLQTASSVAGRNRCAAPSAERLSILTPKPSRSTFAIGARHAERQTHPRFEPSKRSRSLLPLGHPRPLHALPCGAWPATLLRRALPPNSFGGCPRLPRRRDVHRTRTRSPGSSGVGNTASHPAGSAGGAHSKIQRASLGARLTQPCERAVPKRSCQYTPCNA